MQDLETKQPRVQLAYHEVHGELRDEKENFHDSVVKTTGHFQNKHNLKISEKLWLTYCRS